MWHWGHGSVGTWQCWVNSWTPLDLKRGFPTKRILWLSVTSPSVWEGALQDIYKLPFAPEQLIWSYPRKSFRDSAPWNRLKFPISDGIFCQGVFPGNSLSKTEHTQGARFSRDHGVPWYKADKGQWLTLQSPHRCHGEKIGQSLFKSLWAHILLQWNNQLLWHSSRTHSWEVSVHLDAAAQKCHSSVPAQQAPLVAVSGLSWCLVLLMLPQHWFGFFT